ncbi:coproporphyrinogen dehydrogenase HemZ [Halanaerobacter jeridensis]|uniref:Oxygen-independent coproporphyrinogen-3 oxidase n=1 Tax=Halanaerobacter jeridensis TaxID=706427 RepID=A0A938XRT6_9FIRM|nr:coproporphyrinogen dehydrogenase HemZ [Halanaerobacter jeridensis]MBM7556285.1 oxygen-independent coproporphyrinogen-3 oxidase [Halanaerobacter jeridensis]
MKIGLKIDSKYYGPVKGTLKVLLPEHIEIYKAAQAYDFDIIINTQLDTSDGIKVISEIVGDTSSKAEQRDIIKDKEILDSAVDGQDFEKRCRYRLKLSIYRLLCDYLDLEMSPWGILIGVRPTKLVHILLDKGLSYQQVDYRLQNIYGVNPEKRELLLNIVRRERKYIPTASEARKKISIYLGVPFCPTKCDYCSFASYPLKEYGEYVSDFLAALQYEIESIGQVVRDLNLKVDTVYIGGGTPTVLSAEELEEIIKKIKSSFAITGDDLREFMVEAGRPDTINEKKLRVLKQEKVGRISINPQTMQQKTLNKIGRDHTVKDVVQAYKLARKMNFANINMDLIVGLPGEGKEELQLTLEEIQDLQPDSLTVHTLAIKRAANLSKEQSGLSTASAAKINKMLNLTQKTAEKLGLVPYYMYRQKSPLGNFENIGYSKPGQESIYNILMMEEREIIIALGGGGVTKLVDSNDWSLEREINPKFPVQYIKEVEERTQRKIDKLTTLLR